MIHMREERFVDEGMDLRNYTYAKFGRVILPMATRWPGIPDLGCKDDAVAKI